MKKSVGQERPSQGASSKMSRHDFEGIDKTETPTTNVFLIETVLRRLFKQIQSVTMLKDLRRMCQIWDKVDTEELEERAFEGQIKSIDLTFFNDIFGKFQHIKDSCLEMRGFLDDTSSNPRLFRSFTIVFPCSLAVLNLDKFRSFYTEYSPTFLDLAFPTTFRYNQDKELLLKELLRWSAPTLRELVIRNFFPHESALIPFPTQKSHPVQSFNFPHLRKLGTNIFGSINNGIVEAFKVIFAKENVPEIPSLTTLKLEYPYIDDLLLDLNSNLSRWANLTKLNIFCDNNFQRNNRFTNGLLYLAQAGMNLKKLELGLQTGKYFWERPNEDPHFLGTCRNLSHFFASQAGSLEALKLSFKLFLKVSIEEDQEGQIKIQLPVFERLHTLSLDLDTRVYTNGNRILTTNIFEFGSISQQFPALENLTILRSGGSIYEFLAGSSQEKERINLKLIKIGIDWGNEMDVPFDKYFGSVKAFACSQDFLQNLKKLVDLLNTIQVLHIRAVGSELDLSQFKDLRRVVIEEDDKGKKPNWLKKRGIDHKVRYLSYFKKVAELGLDSILFRGLDMIKGPSYKEFAEAFPFRVEFEDTPMDWLDQDFIDN